MRRLVLAVALVVAATLAAQTPPKQLPNADVPRWPVLMDPVCPVSSFRPSPSPNATREMRVMYFPAAKVAKIKDPESLTLQIAFNGPRFVQRDPALPFKQEGDHWEATVPLQHAMYSIFYVKDSTGAIDDNNGNYWDVVFCSPTGTKDSSGVIAQAKTYTGENWPLGIHRTQDLDKAVSVLEAAESTGEMTPGFLTTELLQLKVQRDGGDASAYAKVAAEIDPTLDQKAKDSNYLNGVENFVLRHPNDLPPSFVDHVVSLVDRDRPRNSDSMRAMVAFNRVGQEPDPKKRLAMIDQVMKDFPPSGAYDEREEMRLQNLIQMKNIPGAEASLAKIRGGLPQAEDWQTTNVPNDFEMLARLYIDKGIKFEEAIKLLDETSQSRATLVKNKALIVPPEIEKQEDAISALLRARAYLGLHQPDLAVQQAEIAVNAMKKNAQAHEVLAIAYAATGPKQKALDEYFDAALLPSNVDLQYRDELQRYYRKNFGNEKKYQAELNRRIQERFQAADYVPVLLNRPAPSLNFTTLKGEKFDAANLNGKTVVLNFWSPG